MKTYPELNATIVGVLRTGNEPSQYAAQRIEELEATIAKLPKTADGVPVVPGMEVWETHAANKGVIRSVEDGGEYGVRCNVSFVDSHDMRIQVGGLASTREAAEAAKGK